MIVSGFDTAERVLVIAELGNNHEGDPGVAQRLVREAAAAGVDAVKLQTFRTEHYVSADDVERFARLKSFELPFAAVEELSALARSLGLLFVSTPFDLESADRLVPLVDAIKIASGDNTFYPLIARAARGGRPLILSAGLATLAEVEQAVALVRREWDAHGVGGELAVLHCVSSYPVEPPEANLLAIRALGSSLDCTIGYSDHTAGLDAAPLAVALGARIVEKHFTLDKDFSDFRDHQLSATPDELRKLVSRIRTASAMLGSEEKTVQPSERDALPALRRSIVAAADLQAGHVVTDEDLTWVRPGGGLAPGQEERLLGRRLVRAVRQGEQLGSSDVEP